MNLLKMRLVSWMWRLHHLRFHCKLRRKIIRAMIKTINLLLLLIALNYIKLHRSVTTTWTKSIVAIIFYLLLVLLRLNPTNSILKLRCHRLRLLIFWLRFFSYRDILRLTRCLIVAVRLVDSIVVVHAIIVIRSSFGVLFVYCLVKVKICCKHMMVFLLLDDCIIVTSSAPTLLIVSCWSEIAIIGASSISWVNLLRHLRRLFSMRCYSSMVVVGVAQLRW